MTAYSEQSTRPRLAVLDGFTAAPGTHCETTMLRNMLVHAGLRVSEPMLFGLGRGIDFQYFASPAPGPRVPMLTGRTGPGDIAVNACAAAGLGLVVSEPADPASAEHEAWDALTAGRVVGVTVDIFHLDYFASRRHFSAHCVALYGLDGTSAYVVDTEQQGGAHRLPVESLARARASREGFMPTPHRQWHLDDVPADVLDDWTGSLARAVWPAIGEAAANYLEDRGQDRGPSGMRRAADEARTWHEIEHSESLVPELGRFWRYAGTGGTNFRGLYCDFLAEARALTEDDDLRPLVTHFRAIVAQWADLIDHVLRYPDATDRSGHLEDASHRLHRLADAETSAFARLAELADDRMRAR